jgi:hypothetical protein
LFQKGMRCDSERWAQLLGLFVVGFNDGQH